MLSFALFIVGAVAAAFAVKYLLKTAETTPVTVVIPSGGSGAVPTTDTTDAPKAI